MFQKSHTWKRNFDSIPSPQLTPASGFSVSVSSTILPGDQDSNLAQGFSSFNVYMSHLRGLLIQQVWVIAYDSAFITGFKWCDATSPRITLLNNKDLVYRSCSLMHIPILMFKKSATLNWSDFLRIWHATWPVPPSSFPTIMLLFPHNTMNSQVVSSFLLCPRVLEDILSTASLYQAHQNNTSQSFFHHTYNQMTSVPLKSPIL